MQENPEQPNSIEILNSFLKFSIFSFCTIVHKHEFKIVERTPILTHKNGTTAQYGPFPNQRA